VIHFVYIDELPPAPITQDDTLHFKILSKTIRQVFPQTVVAPSLMIGNTDTRHYWNLTENIFRFNPIVLQDTSGIHGTNEKVDVIHYSRMVNFYNHLIRNADNDFVQHS
jgi:carboxypeptidase PM20D1